MKHFGAYQNPVNMGSSADEITELFILRVANFFLWLVGKKAGKNSCQTTFYSQEPTLTTHFQKTLLNSVLGIPIAAGHRLQGLH